MDEELEFLARKNKSDCEAEILKSDGDVNPQPVSLPCDPAIVVTPKFEPPALPPAKPVVTKRLPEGIVVGNAEQTEVCPDGMTARSGAASVTRAAATDTATVLIDTVVLSDGTRIPNDELYRMAPYAPAVQALADTVLRDGIEFDELVGLIAGALGTTSEIALAISSTLVAAQETVDSIATTAAVYELDCVWKSRQVWVICADNPMGYTVSYVADPGAGSYMVASGFAESQTSQTDADDMALRHALRHLDCLVGNDEVIVDCTDLAALYDTTVNIGSGDIHLSVYDGVVFLERDAIAQGLDGRTLKYFIQELAGMHMASTKEAANAMATTSALSKLDCFFPSAPHIESCAEQENNEYAHTRMNSVYGLTDDPEDMILNEMATGYPDRDRNDPIESGYFPDNEGVTDLVLDTRQALRVVLPAGFYTSPVSQVAATASAETYAKSLLMCVWRSPMHVCACLMKDPSESAVWRLVGPPMAEPPGGAHVEEPDSASYLYDVRTDPYNSLRAVTYKAGYPSEYGWYPIAKLMTANSIMDNTMLPGELVSVSAPVDESGTLWPSLATTCQSKLRCVFQSCLVVMCEPFPDNRQFMRNGEHNWISFVDELGNHILDKQIAGGLWAAAFQQQYMDFLDEFSTCPTTSLSEIFAYFASCGTEPEAKFYNMKGGYGAPAAGLTELLDAITAGWFTAAQNAAIGQQVPTGTPARFLNGAILSDTNAATGKCTDDPSTDIVFDKDKLGYFSGAEGSSRQTNPSSILTLIKLARSQAIGRMNCTHVAWERELGRCDTPSHVPARRASIAYEDIPQAQTTEVANVALELAVLAEMDCQEVAPNQIGMSAMCATVTSLFVDNVGDDDCLPPGVSEILPVDENDNPLQPGIGPLAPIGGPDQRTDAARSFFIVAGCSSSTGSFMLRLLARDSNAEGIEEIWEAASGGNQIRKVPPSVVAFLNEIRGTSNGARVWYLGSIVNRQVANAAGVGRPVQRLAQYYTGPLILTKTCCDSSSSSSSSESESTPSESSDSEGSSDSSASDSGGDSGVPSDSYGSDKSTAIIPVSSSPTGYKCAYTMESNKVLFAFPRGGVEITGRETRVKLNPDWVEVCAPGTLKVYGAPNGDKPFPVSARIEGSHIVIRALPWPFRPAKVDLMLWGLRKGHEHRDLDLRTKAQFDANEKFLNSAYPADPVIHTFHITPP